MCCSPGAGKGASPRLCLATAVHIPPFPHDKETGNSSGIAVVISGWSSALHRTSRRAGAWGHHSLPGLSPREPHVQVVEDGRSLVADSDPVLVYQVAGGHVSIGGSEGLLQGVPFERGHDILPCKGTAIHSSLAFTPSQAQPWCFTPAAHSSLNCATRAWTWLSPLPSILTTPSIACLKPNPAPDLTVADKNILVKAPKYKGGKAGGSRSFKELQFCFHLQLMWKKLSANSSLDHWKQTLIR